MALRRTMLALGGLAMGALGTGATLNYFEEALPSSLNPLFAETMVDSRAQELIFDRLWYNDAITNEVKSRIVARHEVAEAGRAIKITLKEGISWHDGTPLSAKDICFTVDAMLDSGTPSVVAAAYQEFLADCDTQGSSVAVIRFRKVLPKPRHRLGFHVLPAHSFDSTAISPDLDFSARPTGSGAFKGARGRREVIFDGYGNAHHSPSVMQMQLREGGDPLLQVKTLEGGEVQGIIVVPPGSRADLRASDEVSLKSYDLRSWWFIAVNTKNPALQDPKVRKALNLIIDRTELREYTIGVKPGDRNSPCEFISGPFVQASPYYNRTVPTVATANRSKADALLKEAGLARVGGRWHVGDQPITLKIGMQANLNNEATDLLEQIGNQLGDAGFDRQTSKVSAAEWGAEVVAGQSDFDLVIGKWSFGLVEAVGDLFHSSGRKNIFGYSDPQVDSLLNAYDEAVTDTEQKDAYHKLHTRLNEDLPYLFLWKLDTKSAWRTEVRGNIITPYHYFTEIDSWKVVAD
jgi:peptide/nickel transport system substrate-binding protein